MPRRTAEPTIVSRPSMVMAEAEPVDLDDDLYDVLLSLPVADAYTNPALEESRRATAGGSFSGYVDAAPSEAPEWAHRANSWQDDPLASEDINRSFANVSNVDDIRSNLNTFYEQQRQRDLMANEEFFARTRDIDDQEQAREVERANEIFSFHRSRFDDVMDQLQADGVVSDAQVSKYWADWDLYEREIMIANTAKWDAREFEVDRLEAQAKLTVSMSYRMTGEQFMQLQQLDLAAAQVAAEKNPEAVRYWRSMIASGALQGAVNLHLVGPDADEDTKRTYAQVLHATMWGPLERYGAQAEAAGDVRVLQALLPDLREVSREVLGELASSQYEDVRLVAEHVHDWMLTNYDSFATILLDSIGTGAFDLSDLPPVQPTSETLIQRLAGKAPVTGLAWGTVVAGFTFVVAGLITRNPKAAGTVAGKVSNWLRGSRSSPPPRKRDVTGLLGSRFRTAVTRGAGAGGMTELSIEMLSDVELDLIEDLMGGGEFSDSEILQYVNSLPVIDVENYRAN